MRDSESANTDCADDTLYESGRPQITMVVGWRAPSLGAGLCGYVSRRGHGSNVPKVVAIAGAAGFGVFFFSGSGGKLAWRRAERLESDVLSFGECRR
jgi:hypothetical protein